MSSFVAEALSGLMDVREIFYTNLLLLGFDPAGQEEKFRVPFNRDMFVLPNKKGMEVVMHFLFNRLDSHLCYEEFRDCWPVLDKKQEQQFRKTCASWLSRITKENKEARLPRIVASLFLSPGGDRFYDLLVHFSNYVLTSVARREGGRFARIPPTPSVNSINFTLTPVMAKAVVCHSVRERQRFLDSSQKLVSAQQEWTAFASELTREYRALSRAVKEQEQKMEAYISSQRDKLLAGSSHARNVSSGSRSADFYLETARKQRANKLQQVRKYWEAVESFCKNHSAERQVVQAILDGNAQKHRTDAADIEVQVPSVLLPQCQQHLEKGELSNLYRNGKLDLLSLVQLWGLSLDTLKDKLHESGIPDLGGFQGEMATHVHTHHGQLADAQAIRSALSQLLPELKQSISALDARLDKFQLQDSQRTLSTCRSSARKGTFRISRLGLLPATPQGIQFDPSASPLTDKSNIRPMRRTPDTTSTPQAVQSLTATVEKATASRQPKPITTSHIPVRVIRHNKADTPAVSRISVEVERKVQTGDRRKEVSKQTRRAAQGKSQQETSRKHHTVRSEQKNSKVVSDRMKASHQHNVTMPHKTPTGRSSQSMRNVSWEPLVPKAHLLLADQIASYVAGSSESELDISAETTPRHNSVSQIHSLTDPLTALGQDAFVSRDKLMRTPSATHSVSQALSNVSPVAGYLPQPKTATDTQQHHQTVNHPHQATPEERGLDVSSHQFQPAVHPQGFTLLPPSAFETPCSPGVQSVSLQSCAATRQDGITPSQTPFENLQAVTPCVLVFSGESSPSTSRIVDLSIERVETSPQPQRDSQLLINFGSTSKRQEEQLATSSSSAVVSNTSLCLSDTRSQVAVAQTVETNTAVIESEIEQQVEPRQLEVSIERVYSGLTDQMGSLQVRDEQQQQLVSSPTLSQRAATSQSSAAVLEHLDETYLTGQLREVATTPLEANELKPADVQSSSSSLSSLWSGQPRETVSPLHSPVLRSRPDAHETVGNSVVSSGSNAQGLSPLSSAGGHSQTSQHPAGRWSDDDQLLDESMPSLLLSHSSAGKHGTRSFEGQAPNTSLSTDPKSQSQQPMSSGAVDLASQLSMSPLSSLASLKSSDQTTQ